MKEIDREGIMLCKLQGSFFEHSLSLFPNLSSLVFIRRFMSSQYAHILDSGFYWGASYNEIEMKEEIIKEYGDSPYGKEKLDGKTLYWVGYLYRYWALITGSSSKSLNRDYPAKIVAETYLPYHSLSPIEAIKRIIEAKEGKIIDRNDKSFQLELMKEIRKRNR